MHWFYRDWYYPERKWVAAAFVLFLVHYFVTRYLLVTEDLPEPFDSIFGITVYTLFVIAGWQIVGRKGYHKAYRILMFIPCVGILALIVFIFLPSARSEERESSQPELSTPSK